jgi:hypothetical protein
VSERSNPETRQFPLPHILRPGEVLEGHADANGTVIAVTKERLVVAEGDSPVLDIPFSELRRIQFDIERGRPATLVIVPEHITNWPRVVGIPIETLREAAFVLARVGERLNETSVEQTG